MNRALELTSRDGTYYLASAGAGVVFLGVSRDGGDVFHRLTTGEAAALARVLLAAAVRAARPLVTAVVPLLVVAALGCAGAVPAVAPDAAVPDAVGGDLVAAPDLSSDQRRPVPDLGRPDGAPPPRDLRAPEVVARDSSPPPDLRQSAPDVLLLPDASPAPGPEAGGDSRTYANDAGWSPDPETEGACCLPCGDYDGCLTLIRTTPYCTITVGGDCYRGGTGADSVWPRCQPLKSAGSCR